MRLAFRCLLATLVALTAVRAEAVGVTGYLDPLESELSARRAVLEVNDDKPSRKAVKFVDKSLALLRKEKATSSLDKELGFASKAAKLIEKKLTAETTLLPPLDDAIHAYVGDLRAARSGLAAAARTAAKPSKLLKKADKALASFEATTQRSRQLAQLAKLAKFTAGYELTGEAHTWVIESIVLAPANGGVDVDGDGTPDNAFAAAQQTFADLVPGDFDIDQMVADALHGGSGVAILQMWGVDSFDADGTVYAGLIGGTDTDGDAGDNFTGSEVFDVTGALDADGFAPTRSVTAFEGAGQYGGRFGGQDFELAGFTFDESMELFVRGTASANDNVGSLGFAIPVAQIFALLEDQGVNVNLLVRLAVGSILDVDTDGDRQNDALSISFDFDAVSCGIATSSE